MKLRDLAVASAAVLAAACSTRAAPDEELTQRGAPGQPPPARAERFAAFTGASYDAATREVDLVLATGVRVKRFWFSEELEMSASAIDLGRVPLNQARLLFNHKYDDPIGVLISVRLEAGHLVGRARFNDTPRGLEVAGMVERGELTGVSIGYLVKLWRNVEVLEDGHEIWRAVEWELLEGSIVTVPADPHAGVRSVSRVIAPGATGASAEPQEDNDMTVRSAPGADPTPAPAVSGAPAPGGEAARAAPAAPTTPPVVEARGLTASELLAAQASARTVGVELPEADLTRTAIDPVAQVNQRILAMAAERQEGNQLPAFSAGRSGEVGAGERTAVIDVLSSRMTHTRAPASAGELRGFRVAELIGLRMGLRTRDPDEIMGRAMHTTSDFPLLLEAAANKAMNVAYLAATPTYRTFAARRTFVDFKPHKFLRIGEFPPLLPLGEGGEIQGGTIPEAREQVSADTKARLLKLSRKMIVNDDLGALGDLVVAAGRAAARSENKGFYALLLANGGAGPTMSDGNPMFHASHGNLAGAGAVPSITTLGAGRAAMKKQKNIGGDEVLNIAPKFFLVGPDGETVAQQLTSDIAPVIASEVNPFSGRLQPVSDGELTGNAWWLFADPADAPNFIYGYLGDAEGPAIRQDTPFGVDGMALQVIHDFAVGAIDSKGGWRNPGP